MWSCSAIHVAASRASVLMLCALAIPASSLAIIHVRPTGTDTGDGRDPSQPVASLAYALSVALPGEEIRLACASYPTNGVLVQASIVISGGWTNDFTEQLTDPALTVLQGDGSDRVLHLNTLDGADNFELDFLTVRSGDAANSSILPGHGGGILHTGGGSLEITNSLVLSNFGRGASPAGDTDASGFGGGIYTEGALRIENSTISGNRATNATRESLFLDAGGAGGGIYVAFDPGSDPVVSLEVVNSTISNNIARANYSASAVGSAPGNGGGIAIAPAPGASPSPGASLPVNVLIQDSTITNNRALTGNIAAAQGGGLWVDLGDFTGDAGNANGLAITGSTISDNRCSTRTEGFVFGGVVVRGGGGYIEPPGDVPLVIEGSTISNNAASAARGPGVAIGGGISVQGGEATITDTTISGNIAGGDINAGRGGGLDLLDCDATLDRCTFDSNDALRPLFTAPFLEASGGGVFAGATDPAKAFTIQNSALHNNRAASIPVTNSSGGSLSIDLAAGQTGLLWHLSVNANQVTEPLVQLFAGEWDVRNCLFTGGNTAIQTGPGTVTGEVDFCYFHDQADAPVQDAAGNLVFGDSNHVLDPQLADRIAGDLRLQDGSPAIDDGDPSLQLAQDRDGNPRDTQPDVGAFERQQSPPTMWDFGDAPDTYGTLLASDGARHREGTTDIGLGPNVTRETDAIPSPLADSDLADDGLQFLDTRPGCAPDWILGSGPDGQLRVRFTPRGTGPDSEARLSVWLDRDGDGTFTGEQELAILQNGFVQTALPFDETLPGTLAGPPRRYLRARISTQFSLGPAGEAPDGEVEDYLLHHPTDAVAAVTLSTSQELLPQAGQPFEFQVSLANVGQGVLGGGRVRVTARSLAPESTAWQDSPPISYVAAAPPPGTSMVDLGNGSMEWDVNQDLGPNEFVTLSVTATLAAPLPQHTLMLHGSYRCGPASAQSDKLRTVFLTEGGRLATAARQLAALLAEPVDAPRRDEPAFIFDANEDGVHDVADLVHMVLLELEAIPMD